MFSHRFITLFSVLFCFSFAVSAQNLEFERTRHRDMLRVVRDDVKKNYFDPKFKGIDLEAKHKLSVEKLSKAESIGQMSGIIAQFLLDFDDSHLYFSPRGKLIRRITASTFACLARSAL